MPFFAQKVQIFNFIFQIFNFNNFNGLTSVAESSEPRTAGEVNIGSWEIVGEQLGERWDTTEADNRDIFYTCAKIPKPEVKSADDQLHA